MLAAIRLAEAGIDHVVLEKNADVGGTWLENAYPGAGVDTPSHLYSYSFAPRRWSTHFGKRDEVLTYLRDVADAHDLREVIRFGTEVASAVVPRPALDRHHRRGRDAHRGRRDHRRRPAQPAEDPRAAGPGHVPRARCSTRRAGPRTSTSPGKRVAVVGTGASAMQIVPAIAERAGHVTVFQRSPQWVAPNDVYFAPIDDAASLLMEHVPFYRRWYRIRLSWIFNDKVHADVAEGPRSGSTATARSTRSTTATAGCSPGTWSASSPGGPTSSRRRCRTTRRSASGCCSTTAGTRRSAATTSTSSPRPSPRSRRRACGRQDGTETAADVVVLCTGFEAQKLLWPLSITGATGRTIADVWGPDDADAHLGITVPGFPNLFLICGPNTVLGHGGSYITIAECQVRYIVEALVGMVENGIGAVEVLPEVHADYAARDDAAHAAMIWTHPGMRNWYRNPAGRVVCALPWRIVDYWTMTRHVDWNEYAVESRGAVS